MREFIKLLIVFFFPIFIAAISVEYLLRSIPNDYTYKRKYLDVHSNSIEVLFLGNSHIFYGINPEHMSRKSFNASHLSQSLNYDLAILEKYDGKWKGLKFIIIPVDYFTLYSSLENGIEEWRVKNYNIYYGIKRGNYQDYFELFNGKLSNNINGLKDYLLKDKSYVTCNNLGFGTIYKSKDALDLDETGTTAAERHTMEMLNNPNYQNNIDVIKSIIDFSNKNKAAVIFITAPAYKTYSEKLEINQLNNTLSTIKQLASKGQNTYYYNFLNDTSFLMQDFYDADHLNEKGAKKFTLKIDSIITTMLN